MDAQLPLNVNGVTFTDVCPDSIPRSPYRLHRIEGKAPVIGTILTPAVFGTYVHYYGNHSMPCLGAGECDVCDRIAKAWHAYIGFQFDKSGKVVILDILANVADQLKQLRSDGSPLRGVRCKIYRHNGKNNGSLICDISPVRHDGFGLAPPMDVVAHMFNVWRNVFKPTHVDPSEADIVGSQPIDKQKRRNRAPAKGANDVVADLASRIGLHEKNRVNGSLPGQKQIFGPNGEIFIAQERS